MQNTKSNEISKLHNELAELLLNNQELKQLNEQLE